MDNDIFESRKNRELQRLRQQLASNIIKIDPNLKGYLDRFDPDVSRATLLRLQRQRIPTKEQLEKLSGIKTAKKLKGRKTKNLRGEVPRAILERKRFEKGERRYKPEEEPRIVGEPAPIQAGQGGFHYDPEVERERIRVQALGQLQTARIANRRLDIEARQLEINRQLADRERGERQRQFNIENRRSEEQLALEQRQLDALLDRQQDDRERFEEDIRQRKKERKLQRELQSRALETEEYRTEQEKKLRELEIGKKDIVQLEELRLYDELKTRELNLVERRLDLDRERARGAETRGLSQADRDFLQRGFERSLETLERRFGENEARIQEQIRSHAERVGQQQPLEIKLVQPEQTGPTAKDIALSVREALQDYREEQRSPRRRIDIQEVEESTPIVTEKPKTQSPRPALSLEESTEITPIKESPSETSEFFTPQEQEEERQGLFESAELVDPRNLPQEGFPETKPLPEPQPEVEEGELFESGFFAGGIEALAQNAIGFVGDATGRAAEGIAGLFKPEIGEQTGGRLDPEGQIFGLGQEIEAPPPTIEDVPSAEPQRRPAVVQTSQDVINISPERIQINRDILEAQLQANRERYKTEFADKFQEEYNRLKNEWLDNYFSKHSELEEDEKELITDVVFGAIRPGRPDFDAEKYTKRANRYYEKNRDKELFERSNLYKTETNRQESLLRDVNERLQKKNFEFEDAELYVKSLTENRPEQVLNRGYAAIKELTEPVSARGVVEEVAEEKQEAEGLEEGEGLIEEEVQAVIQPSDMNDNLRLFEALEPDIDTYSTRGRPRGGARGDLPYYIQNITDKTFKGLAPGQIVAISQVERDGRIGYYPGSRIRGEKIGITRMGREVLRKQIRLGKLKVTNAVE